MDRLLGNRPLNLLGSRSERFELVRWGTKWLSKHPDVPGSKDWDAVSLELFTRFLSVRMGGRRSARGRIVRQRGMEQIADEPCVPSGSD